MCFREQKNNYKGEGTFGIHAPFRAIPNSLYLLLPLGLREGDFEAKKRAMENHGNLKSATTENQLKKI